MLSPRLSTVIKSKALVVTGVAILAMVAIGAYSVRHTSAFINATTHQPERYTELYFKNPTKLPATVAPGAEVPVSFTAHNVEAHAMSYPYAVDFITNNGDIVTKEKGGFWLPNGGSKTVTSDIHIPKTYSG